MLLLPAQTDLIGTQCVHVRVSMQVDSHSGGGHKKIKGFEHQLCCVKC